MPSVAPPPQLASRTFDRFNVAESQSEITPQDLVVPRSECVVYPPVLKMLTYLVQVVVGRIVHHTNEVDAPSLSGHHHHDATAERMDLLFDLKDRE